MTVIFSNRFKALATVLLFMTHTASAECIKNADALYVQGKDHFSRAQYLLATQHFSMASLLSCKSDVKNKNRLRWAQSLFELSENEEALRIIDEIPKSSPLSHQAKIIKAWYVCSFLLFVWLHGHILPSVLFFLLA